MSQFRQTAVESRVKWYGVNLPWDPSKRLYEIFKNAVQPKAWDAGSKVWWVPETCLFVVRDLFHQHGFLNEAASLGTLIAGLQQQKTAAVKRMGWAEEPNAARSNSLYATLGLIDNAPPELVDIAFKWWKRELEFRGAAPGPATPLMEIERAYALLKGEG